LAKEEAARAGLSEISIYASMSIARCYYKEGRPRTAYLSVRNTLNEIETIYVRQRTLPVRNRILSSFRTAYELAAQCCFDLSYLNKALGYLERIKARGLLNQMMSREFSYALDSHALEESLSKEEDRILSQFGDFLLHQLGDEKLPNFPLEFDKHGITKARRLLGLGRRVLIEMFFTTEQLICLLVGGCDIGSGNELSVIRVPAANHQWMSGLLKDFWFTGYVSSTINKASYDQWLLDIQVIGSQLGEKIWTALGATIDAWNPRHLVFVPHLGLQFLPLHLISLDNGEVCLLDRFNVSYAPSLSTLSICRRFRATRADQGDRLLFLSNPTKDLGFAGLEASLVGDLFDDKVVLMRDDATVGAFHSWSKSASIIHLACHGGFSKGDPSTSLLRLADGSLTVQELGAKAGSVFSPGGMAILSACESGIVALDQVDEFIGLPYGFLAGGCSTVVSSLWPVDDMATAILMGRFYLYLVRDRLTKPEALARAQRWVRDATNFDILNYVKTMGVQTSRRELDLLPEQERRTRSNTNERPFAHPFFWGSFVCHGYWD
jgi:CHAT domain-containing protein